jgi:2-dehydropantoate 2-reductase
VIFIETQGAQRQAIQQHGLRLAGIHGTHTLPIPIVSQAVEVRFRDDDVVILAVKAFHSAAAIAALTTATGRERPIFCAQNGVRNEAIAAGYFYQVHGMMLLVAAHCLSPGVVVQTGNGPLGIGTYPRGLSQTAVAVAAALESTDLPLYTTEDIVAAKWYKLLLNLNNATMGLTGLGTSESYTHTEVRQWMADVWEEGWRVVQAAGIAIAGPPDMGTIRDRIAELRHPESTPRLTVADTFVGYSSLWQDLYHRRGDTEADALNGEIVRLGHQYQVPTPYNRLLLTLSNAMAAARDLPGKYPITQLWERLNRAEL